MDRLASVLLLRAGRVHLPTGSAAHDGFVDHLEIDLAERGWLLDAAARAAIAAMEGPVRTAWAGWLLATLDAEVGADRPHVPLFRRFPDDVPGDSVQLYVERVLAFLLQEPDQPCVLCGREGGVAPVSPCGHLVCRRCFDGSNYSACPICNQRIDADDPFLVLHAPRWRKPPSAPLRMRRIMGREHKRADAVDLRDRLVYRPSPLTAADRDDLAMLIEATAEPGDLSWLSPTVPARENVALVLAVALRQDMSKAVGSVAARWTTATDIARTLWAFSGGDPGLILPGKPAAPHASEVFRPDHEPAVAEAVMRVAPIPRALRSSVLAALDGLDLRNAVEDVLRHPSVWKRLGERLHPFEYADRFPRAAVCFAVLRRSVHPVDSEVGRAIIAAGADGVVHAVVAGEGVRARAKTFAALIERYLADEEIDQATRLLSTRPGEFLRRLDHLARLTPADGFGGLAVRAGAAAQVASPAVALAAYAALTARDEAPPAVAIPRETAAAARGASTGGSIRRLRGRRRGAEAGPRAASQSLDAPDDAQLPRNAGRVPGMPRRVFFPRGNVMRAWSALDRRPLLPAGGPDVLRYAIVQSLVGRAGAGARFEVAIVDAALSDYPVPTRARTTSASSRSLPRGARVGLPDGDTLRLFLHWMQPDEHLRVDLDLSALFLDAAWEYVGHCDYTALRFPGGAVHSGDLTSAPPPLGATEYLDLHIRDLRAAGVARVVPIVFSFNDVPFDRLADAIAGFSLPSKGGEQFEGARVFTRFDLVGSARVLVPMVVHLEDRTLRWADLNVSSSGYGHAVHRYSTVLGNVAEDLELAFGIGRRASMLQLAAFHAAARASRVFVRYTDGSACEVPAEFDAIIGAAEEKSGAVALPALADRSVLYVAADRLPDQIAEVGPGSILVAATGGDNAANADPFDLLGGW